MGRMTVTLDEELLAQAREALGASTKAETIRLALSLALRRKRLSEALGHRGGIELDVDQERLARLRGEG